MAPMSPRRSSLDIAPQSLDSLLSYNMLSFEAEEAAGAASAYSFEGHLWKHIGRDDLSNGVVQEVVFG